MSRVDVVDARSGAVVTPRGTWIYFARDGRGLGGAADLRARESVS